MKALLHVHTAATLAMVGVIWFVQVVHYPLMGRVSEAAFPGFQQAHVTLTGYVVAPLMLAEVASAAWLARHRGGVRRSVHGLALGLLAVVWLSTFLWQVPLHERLAEGFDAVAHTELVTGNWLRTVAWTGRGLLALVIASRWSVKSTSRSVPERRDREPRQDRLDGEQQERR